MSSSHLLYIPLVILVGVFLGFGLGAKAARNAWQAKEMARRKRAQDRAKKREQAKSGNTDK